MQTWTIYAIFLLTVFRNKKHIFSCKRLLHDFMCRLNKVLEIKFRGQQTSFIVWKIRNNYDAVTISQSKVTTNWFQEHRLSKCDRTLTSLAGYVENFLTYKNELPVSAEQLSHYQKTVLKLICLLQCMPMHISHITSVLTKRQHAPSERYKKLVKRVLLYLETTVELWLSYCKEKASGLKRTLTQIGLD